MRGYLSGMPFVKKLLTDVDVLAISEHWLHSNRLGVLNEVSDTHYVFARASKNSAAKFYGSRRGQGGVAIYWRKSIPGFSKVREIIHDRACVIRYQPKKGVVFFFISVYLPAQGSEDDLETVLDEVSEIIESREPGSNTILLGDFNGDVGSQGGPRSHRPPTHRGKCIMNLFDRFGYVAVNMQQLAHGPLDTFSCHNGHSTIDFITVPRYLMDSVDDCYVKNWEALNTSDHRDVHMSIQLPDKATYVDDDPVPGRIKWSKPSVKRQFKDKTAQSLLTFREKIRGTHLSPNTLDPLFQELTDILHKASVDLPRTKFVKRIKPYWNEDLSRLKREKIQTYRVWVDAGRPRDPDDPLMRSYKASKRAFMNTIRRLAKQYESHEVCKAVQLAEVNRNSFWRLVKRCRNSSDSSNISISRPDGSVVNEVKEVLEVWRSHFANLGTPKHKPNFDDRHFEAVTELVKTYNDSDNIDDDFLNNPFTLDEINSAIKTLNRGKAAGFNLITAEHVIYADENITEVLLSLYNAIVDLEVIPICFRTGLQIPLFKGKDLDILDPNNYRGITLLSTFNKVFEILVWHRLKFWWTSEKVISELQGACKTVLSCIHTAFMLQETVAASMEDNGQCFVTFFDVAKAFDTVWIDGLFKQVYDLGVTGKTWRLLYRGYIDFKCRVRIAGNLSESYNLNCGIHQGGYLSLLKYTVFINSLLVSLRDSGLCAKIYRTPSTPLGYADDLAAVCLSKRRTDAVMDAVYNHGCTWRYDFNARKSGVLVFGENRRTHERNASNRTFKLGPARVKEVTEYDHVGVKTSIFHECSTGIEERVGKARRALNAITGLGIRRNGINIATCNCIFWTIIVPIATYGCELWHLNGDSIKILETFQIYAGKKIQRLYCKSPNVCSFFGLGWMRLLRVIQVRKLLFVRSILALDDQALSKKIFIDRARRRLENMDESPLSEDWSKVDDLLDVVNVFKLNDEVTNMVLRGQDYPKTLWKKIVWERGWALEDTFWCLEARLHKELDLLLRVCPKPRYLTWWSLSNKYANTIQFCETMAKIISHASLLKCDDVRLKHLPYGNRVCSLCNLYLLEDVFHITMQCPGTQHLRNEMQAELAFHPDIDQILREHEQDTMSIYLGKYPAECDYNVMEKLWCITGRHISGLYKFVLSCRQGIG